MNGYDVLYKLWEHVERRIDPNQNIMIVLFLDNQDLATLQILTELFLEQYDEEA